MLKLPLVSIICIAFSQTLWGATLQSGRTVAIDFGTVSPVVNSSFNKSTDADQYFRRLRSPSPLPAN